MHNHMQIGSKFRSTLGSLKVFCIVSRDYESNLLVIVFQNLVV